MESIPNLPKYIFHGTDAKIFNFTPENRYGYFGACRMVLDALYPFYQPIQTTDTYDLIKSCGMDDIKTSLTLDAIINLHCIHDGHGQYHYGDLYLHAFVKSAWGYALRSFGGGELGTTTYLLINAAESLGFDFCTLDIELQDYASRIKRIAELPATPLLFIFPTEELDLEYLKDDQGGDLNPDEINLQRFRYEKRIDLSKRYYVKLPLEINPSDYTERGLRRLVGELLGEPRSE